MFRRFSINYVLLSIFLDATLTALALHLAVSLRPHLPPLPYLVEIPPTALLNIQPSHYLILPLLWIIIFLLNSVYDPKHNYRIVD